MPPLYIYTEMVAEFDSQERRQQEANYKLKKDCLADNYKYDI
ncbi:hypothetical protein GGR06_003139 [Bacteroides reticulotermitis]|uniref:Uncharacterized protein n=1 Tax=Bacteroides reticulotermitis TaxID=1133319 RepID=A0A840CYW8_9BACE|nr:hypothetical protein [Bacteroides reticulotermitis]